MFGKKAFIVSYENFLEKMGIKNKVQNMLKKNNVDYFVFDKIKPEPDLSLMENGRDLFKKNKCDFVIAIGGGSVIDSGKGVAMLSINQGACIDFLDDKKIKNSPLPLIAMPTTAGTGSEVTKYLVFADKKNKKKFTIKSEKVCPSLAIIDPQLTLNLPKNLTATTAVDSLVHCVEGYLNTKSNPYVSALSLMSVKTIITKLNKLIKNPRNLKLREEIMFSATLGGIVITNARTGVIHTMAAAIEPYCHLSHGEVVGRMLPKVLRFYINQGKCRKEMVKMFQYIYGQKINSPEVFIKKVEDFILDIFKTNNFKDQNISEDLIDEFIKRVFMDKGLPEVSPININVKNIQKLFKIVLYT